MTPKEIRAHEVIAHPERFEAESAEIKAYEMTTELTGETRIETIVAILSGLTGPIVEPILGLTEPEAEEVIEAITPKKKGRPAKKKK